MINEMIKNLVNANENLKRQQRNVTTFLQALMNSAHIKTVQDVDGNILFADHDMDDVHVREWTTMTSLVIEGINAQGQPIYSDTEEGMTNTWDDVPVDFLIQAATALNELLETQGIHNASFMMPISADLETKINAAITNVIITKVITNDITRTGDNTLNDDDDNVVFIPELGANMQVRFHIGNPCAAGDQPKVKWALHHIFIDNSPLKVTAVDHV